MPVKGSYYAIFFTPLPFFGKIWYAFRRLIIMDLKRILIASFALLLIPVFISAFTGPTNSACPGPDQGLVPCGGKDCPCTICHFFELIRRILNFFLIKIIPPLAILMVVIGGFMYMGAFSGAMGAGPSVLSKAKSLFISVAVGLLIIYGSFIIVGFLLQAIGLANWTTDIYHNWWNNGFFEINC
jgi:hypothetical protein